jgi:hypothetical protein
MGSAGLIRDKRYRTDPVFTSDLQCVFLSTACSVDMQGVSVPITGRVDMQGVPSPSTVFFIMPDCPASHQSCRYLNEKCADAGTLPESE